MAALRDFEGFVREKIVKGKYTYKQLSDTLQYCFPEERGFSVRLIKRFCNEKEIRKTTKFDDQELDEVVTEAVLQVFTYISNPPARVFSPVYYTVKVAPYKG